jgi:hypothetical protein
MQTGTDRATIRRGGSIARADPPVEFKPVEIKGTYEKEQR